MPKLKVSNEVAHDIGTHALNDDFYHNIKRMCRDDALDPDLDLSPHVFRHSRGNEWPAINDPGMGEELSCIYNAVKETGLPNAIGARVQLPTQLDLDGWERNLTQSDDHQELLAYIKFGFPLGYMGPTSDSVGIPNHSSAMKYPQQIDTFIRKELELGGSSGPWLIHHLVVGRTCPPS